MALDPNILLSYRAPDLMSAIQRGLQAGETIRQAPLIDAMLKARAEQARRNQLGLSSDYMSFLASIKDLSPEQQQEAILIRNGLAPRAVGSAEQTITNQGNVGAVADTRQTLSGASEQGKKDVQLTMNPQIAAATETAKSTAGRGQTSIQVGLDAAKGIPVIKRSLALLDSVGTGGFNRASLAAKQMFGIESANEAELSASLGEAVLGDLRATFGAQFTEREGERLQKIRAGLGKSTEGNKRLLGQALQIAEDAANRSMKQAADSGDYRTAQEIKDFLDFQFKFEEPKQDSGGIKFLGFE